MFSIIYLWEGDNVALEALDKVTRILQAWNTEEEETEKALDTFQIQLAICNT